MFFGLGNERGDDVEAWNAYVDAQGLSPNLKRRVPVIQGLGPGRSNHRIVSPPKFGTNVEVLRALQEIHRYYDTHHTRLAREYEESEAAWVAYQEWLRLHPPVPQDTTINFFPIQSAYEEGQEPAQGGK